VRLRRFRAAFICRRQRRPAIHLRVYCLLFTVPFRGLLFYMLRQVLSIHAALDKTAQCVYNNSEEQTTHTVSSSRCYIEIVAYATNRPSLSRSGGRLFTVACLGLHGSFPDDDRHGILSYVEGETHTHHLLSEGWNQPPACLLFTLHRPLSGIFILHASSGFVNSCRA